MNRFIYNRRWHTKDQKREIETKVLERGLRNNCFTTAGHMTTDNFEEVATLAYLYWLMRNDMADCYRGPFGEWSLTSKGKLYAYIKTARRMDQAGPTGYNLMDLATIDDRNPLA